MNTLDTKALKKLLNQATFEIQYIGEVEIFHNEEEDFSFTYDVNNDTLQSRGVQVTGEQKNIICDAAYSFHEENQTEVTDNAFEHITDYHNEFGTTPQMFI